jgi:hypothetical protein
MDNTALYPRRESSFQKAVYVMLGLLEQLEQLQKLKAAGGSRRPHLGLVAK